MNTNKIREALRIAKARIMHLAPGSPDYIDEALAELDKAPKALTDEEVREMASARADAVAERNVPAWHLEMGRAEVVLKWARDNGYIAPAAGLTVEEAEQIAVDARIELDETEWRSPPVSYEKEFRYILKRRLTAAMEAKTRKA